MAQEPQPRRVYVYARDAEAAQAAIETLGSQISELAVQPFTNPIYGEVVRLTFSANEEALERLATNGPKLIDLAVLPTYDYVGEVPWKVLEDAEARKWLVGHGIRVTGKKYKPLSVWTILTHFTLEAPNVLVLEEAKRYLKDRITALSS